MAASARPAHEPFLRLAVTEPHADHTDASLAAGGDMAAFERLYRRHLARVHALSARMLGSSDVDDVVQDVFIRCWEKLAMFRGESSFGTWLHRLAINVILGHRGSAGVRRSRSHEGSDALLDIPGRPSTVDDGLDFEAALKRLPDGMREIFLLHDVVGYKHEEIARALGISAGTSKSQLHRCRMALRRHLDG